MRLLLTLVAVGAASASVASPVTTLDDIRFWTGEGANRVAVAIDWHGASAEDESLVWGYRWDGAATGEDALRAVIAVDDRTYAKFAGIGVLGSAIIGLGYDANDDGQFAISDNTSFGPDGIAQLAPSDGATPLPGDWYAEGWEDGYWHYGVRSPGGVWETSPVGAGSRSLADGDWQSYAFAITDNYDEFAQNLIAAAPPTLAGDFSGNGVIDAADYTVWRDTLGEPGGLTPADYDVWRAAYLSAGAGALSVPEPSVIALVLWTLLAVVSKKAVRRTPQPWRETS